MAILKSRFQVAMPRRLIFLSASNSMRSTPASVSSGAASSAARWMSVAPKSRIKPSTICITERMAISSWTDHAVMSGIRVPPMRSKNVAIVLKNSPIRLAF